MDPKWSPKPHFSEVCETFILNNPPMVFTDISLSKGHKIDTESTNKTPREKYLNKMRKKHPSVAILQKELEK